MWHFTFTIQITNTPLSNYQYFSDKPDTLICGNCKEMFRNIIDIINHKRHYCKLRFACKCFSTPTSLSILQASGFPYDTELADKGTPQKKYMDSKISNFP